MCTVFILSARRVYIRALAKFAQCTSMFAALSRLGVFLDVKLRVYIAFVVCAYVYYARSVFVSHASIKNPSFFQQSRIVLFLSKSEIPFDPSSSP